MTFRTLTALRSLAARCKPGVGPTTGAIAMEAGQAYRQTQRDLEELVAQGAVTALEPQKAESYAPRFLPVEAATVIRDGGDTP
jgi:hypothetical protein